MLGMVFVGKCNQDIDVQQKHDRSDPHFFDEPLDNLVSDDGPTLFDAQHAVRSFSIGGLIFHGELLLVRELLLERKLDHRGERCLTAIRDLKGRCQQIVGEVQGRFHSRETIRFFRSGKAHANSPCSGFSSNAVRRMGNWGFRVFPSIQENSCTKIVAPQPRVQS